MWLMKGCISETISEENLHKEEVHHLETPYGTGICPDDSVRYSFEQQLELHFYQLSFQPERVSAIWTKTGESVVGLLKTVAVLQKNPGLREAEKK